LTRPISRPTGPQPACQEGGALPRHIGRTKGVLNSKLHALCDGLSRPIIRLLSEGQMSNYKGVLLLASALPRAEELLADKGYGQRLSQRLVLRRADRARRRALRLAPRKKPQGPKPLRHRPLPPAPQDRECLRQDQGLVKGRNPLLPLRLHLHVRHLHRRNRHHLAQSMSPEPKVT